MSYPPCPNPDRKALEALGARVRERLAADPSVEKVPVEAAEIWAVAEFLSPAECDRLIGLVDAGAKPSGLLTDGYGTGWRTSYSGDVDPTDPFVMMIERRIDDLLGIPHEWGETIQGQRYEPGQEFREHMDWFWTKAKYWKDEARRGGQRGITAMAYLNDVEAGGATEFLNLGISIAPQRGALIVWNNAGIDGSLNQATLHAGRPVEAGVKYVITKWYRSRKWG
ncbi:MAG TPA: 2OG-Fe(II) oxygenase [Novosphingobium sp.]|jgi:prolyl 4-hydroxylase|nr:2OG-Fe(II) oxygenase [Novosphingobium sp.]HPZ47025.1 2OG-Fe(II) oxygenase [Novosphingobium sp.]HQE00027.1 2OG-Fe(II) oxygenase [Novosphingobium sp.]